MKNTSNTRRSMPPWKYYTWVAVFFAILFSVVMLVYIATIRIDYTWGWYKLPSAFIHHKEIEITSDIEGKVTRIERRNDQAVITVQDATETKSYTVPAEDIRVTESDLVYYGDTLAAYREWQPGIMLQGLWITLKVSLFAIIVGIIIGIIGGIARISDNPALKWSAITYVELIRGSPLLVQIFIWYFVLGTMINQLLTSYGLKEIPSLWYGVASLACFTGAYVTEIVRAGIQSIHRGQNEAARSLGMSYGQCMRYVILPQAMRRILPPLAGQFISLIKDSSLLGIIAVRELLKATREVITTQLNPFEMFFTAAALYLVITFALSMFVQYLERKGATT
ncbi:MAG: amino acid ABC transporter permease [Desulfobacterales bacterium]|nr:amino acid ABC transporter permease [Desulfobacterales bacterium]